MLPSFEGFGEDMGSAGIETGSADAVVMTLVLCSVKDQVKVIKVIAGVFHGPGSFSPGCKDSGFVLQYLRNEAINKTAVFSPNNITLRGIRCNIQ